MISLERFHSCLRDLKFILTLTLLLAGFNSYSQCPDNFIFFNSATPPSDFDVRERVANGIYAGEHVLVNLSLGEIYTFDSIGAPYDSIITIRNNSDGQVIAFSDNDFGDDGQITVTVPATATYKFQVNAAGCTNNIVLTELFMTRNSGGSCTKPTTQATNAVFGTVTINSIELSSYTAPLLGADGYAVYMNDTNTFITPNNGEQPIANTVWQNSGQQPIYFGNSVNPNITVSGLADNTSYYFQIYAYNNCLGIETYNTGLNASTMTLALPQVPISGGVGIGTNDPKVTLDVNGVTRSIMRTAGGATLICNADAEGSFGYDSSDKKLKVCTNISGAYEWKALNYE